MLFSGIGAIGQETKLKVLKPNVEVKITYHVLRANDTVLHGEYKQFFRNVKLVEGTYQNGLRHGIWKRYFPDGKLWIKGNYFKGKPDGKWEVWFSDGKPAARMYFNIGVKTGHWEGFYVNHEKSLDLIFAPAGFLAQAVNYYPSGRVAINEEAEVSKGDTLTFRSTYYSNYNIHTYVEKRNGLIDGQRIRYHKTGSIWESFTYTSGRLKSVVEMREEKGRPLDFGTLWNGNGLLKTYYLNGTLYSEQSYKNGLLNGPITIYNNGKVAGTGHFKNGKPSGQWEIYNKFYQKKVFLQFDTLSDTLFFRRILSASKNEVEEGPFYHGKKEGLWKVYNSYGEAVRTAYFSQGFMHGKYQSFYEFSTTEEGSYVYGNKTGTWEYFSGTGGKVYKETYRCQTQIDTNWDRPPKPGMLTIIDVSYLQKLYNNFFTPPEKGQVYMYFTEPIPGIDLVSTEREYIKMGMKLFDIQRGDLFVYKPVFIPPVFPGGTTQEKRYLDTFLKMPDLPKGTHIEGSVLVRFKVNIMGIITDLKILKTLGFGTEEIVKDFVLTMPAWRPATFNGIPVESYVVKEFFFKK